MPIAVASSPPSALAFSAFAVAVAATAAQAAIRAISGVDSAPQAASASSSDRRAASSAYFSSVPVNDSSSRGSLSAATKNRTTSFAEVNDSSSFCAPASESFIRIW